jgi:flagellar protein FlaF
MYENHLKSYETVPTEGNPAQSEVWALTQAALKMRNAVESGDVDEMKAAVRLNWRLWTIFQADLLSPRCEIPHEIRQNILTLANFIDKHSVKFMGAPVVEDVDVLININREIAGGLNAGLANEEHQKPQPDTDQGQAEGVDEQAKIAITDLEA